MFPVADRSATTLISVITQHILPGLTIVPDLWLAYTNTLTSQQRLIMNDEICKGVLDTKMLHLYRYHHTDIGADTDADNTSIIYSIFF